MKTLSWMTCLLLSGAQWAHAIEQPRDPGRPTPEQRAAMGLPAAREQKPSPPPTEEAAVLRNIPDVDAPSCAQVTVSAPVVFHGLRLIEIPDIQEPDLRLANQLMSSGCFQRARLLLERFQKSSPGNVHAQYIVARMGWMRLSRDWAERVLQRALRTQPDFVSAQVLLAGIRYEQERFQEYQSMLDAVQPRSPNDLWIFMGRQRLEAQNHPSAAIADRLLEIVRHTGFPPNAREAAAEAAKSMPLTDHQYEAILRAQFAVESSQAMACKANELAYFLGEEQGRFAEVIKLLESPRAKRGNCLGLEENRLLLAEAYLMEAATIGPGPSPENQHLINRASQVVKGDFASVAAHARKKSFYPPLEPFFDALIQPAAAAKQGAKKKGG